MSTPFFTSIPVVAFRSTCSSSSFASDQSHTSELSSLITRIQSWRQHKTFKTQAIPDELKLSIAKLLTSGLHSRTYLTKQLGISYNQISNIEANFVDNKALSAHQPQELNFLPFKIVPHNQAVNSASCANNSNQDADQLNLKLQNNQPVPDPGSITQVKDIVIHKADGAILTLPTNLSPELLYNITQLFLCSK